MKKVKLNLRDATDEISATCPLGFAERTVAALCADPVTLDELAVALERFMSPDPNGFFHGFHSGLSDPVAKAGLVVIDLAARLVVADSACFALKHAGSVNYHDGKQSTDFRVRFDLAEEWELSSVVSDWQSLANARRNARTERGTLDARAILFGQPLLEFVAAECFAIFPRREQIAQAARVQRVAAKQSGSGSVIGNRSIMAANPDGPTQLPTHEADNPWITGGSTAESWHGQERYTSPFYNTLKDIHARWLMSPRDDLRGQFPREVLLAQHEHLMSDMQHRCDQWSLMQECPRGVPEDSHTYRFGGFGTHELVMYYELIRELLWSCWNELMELVESPNSTKRPAALAAGDFLAMEIPRLEGVRELWLDTPQPDFDGHTPRSIIHQERTRIPFAVSGDAAMIDPDCPCCQMLAELPGPMFWNLDASGMDYEFPFDIYYRTREEWDREQADYDNFRTSHCSSNKPHAGGEAVGLIDSDSIWSRSFSNTNSGDVPLGVRIFGLGGHLAELIVDLREQTDATSFADRINRDFGNLREVLGVTGEESRSALVDPTILRFTDTLEDVSESYPHLEPKCSDLIRKLQSLVEPPLDET